jgi:hypothetical protein
MEHFHKKKDIYEEQRRKEISSCLDLLQKIGVDTTNFSDVIKLLESQITREVFADLDIEELQQLSLKLRMILKKKIDNE